MKSKYSLQTIYDLNKELNKATNPTIEDIVLFFNIMLANPRSYDDTGETFIWSCALLYFNNCIISEPTDLNAPYKYYVEITHEHIEQKYNELSEADQLAVTTATGYNNEDRN
ncbi:hypothetical protein K8B83_18905 [Shewanella inventionis]|uniref:hypothetical protein n=1 Tax=Shewanella inventionis TaxID=1738770 RepID=UPI001CBBA428|nr:hypothetical protein [Shewanella inventionis]UAL42862.1 hypothetical protein K8B83_18905 [Shewanella inventionis]